MAIRLSSPWMKLILLMFGTLPLCAQLPTVFIDNPSVGATISGTFTVSGWALDNFANSGTSTQAAPMNYVTIHVDGVTLGIANLGISRPDVCLVIPSAPSCPNVGWAYSLNTATLTQGYHLLTAIATDLDI